MWYNILWGNSEAAQSNSAPVDFVFCPEGMLRTKPKKLQIRSLGSTSGFSGLVWDKASLSRQRLWFSSLAALKNREALWEQMERRSNSNEPTFPLQATSDTPEQAWSITCFGAFPVCCSHDNGIICPAFKANTQSGESYADCSAFKTGAAAGELSEELFQGLNCRPKKKSLFLRQKQLQFAVSQRRVHRGQLWHKYTVKNSHLLWINPKYHEK